MKSFGLVAAATVASVLCFGQNISAVPVNDKVPFAGHKVFQFDIKNKEQLADMQRYLNSPDLGLDLWSEELGLGPVEIQIPPQSATKLYSTLLASIPNKVVIDDIQTLIDAEAAHTKRHSAKISERARRDRNFVPTADEIFSDYQDAEVYLSFLKSIPGTSEVEVGKSFRNRTISGVKFGEGDKSIVIHGGIHAREWISPATVAYIGYALASNVDDPAIQALKKRFTFYVIPVLNVDGYARTRSSVLWRLWRKNDQPTGIPGCVGTDPNRNFAEQWGKPGASTFPCAPNYQGTGPFSAPESKAIADFILKLGNVESYIDFHAFSQLWMFPYGHTCKEKVPDFDTLEEGGNLAIAALKSVNGVDYKNGPVCTTIYPASGSSVDWVYGVAKVKYTYTVELRGQNILTGGFVLPASQIVPSGKETTAAVVALWSYVAKNLDQRA
ncbi:Carboxypeptidase A4 [Quaeritorhiza haematococci]|nr:Carboxypeptidase A4 [Quaeritorhiza haematococci]